LRLMGKRCTKDRAGNQRDWCDEDCGSDHVRSLQNR